MSYDHPPPYTGPGAPVPGYPPANAPGYPPQGYPPQGYPPQGFPPGPEQGPYPNYPAAPPGPYPVQPGYQGYPVPPQPGYGGPMYGEAPKNTGEPRSRLTFYNSTALFLFVKKTTFLNKQSVCICE